VTQARDDMAGVAAVLLEVYGRQQARKYALALAVADKIEPRPAPRARQHRTSPRDAPAPVLVGPHNASAAVGVPWRRVRDAAQRAGLRPIAIGKSGCYRMADIVRAFAAAVPAAPRDPLQSLRDELNARIH